MDNDGVTPFNEAFARVQITVLSNFQRIAMVFDVSTEVIQRKEATIVEYDALYSLMGSST